MTDFTLTDAQISELIDHVFKYLEDSIEKLPSLETPVPHLDTTVDMYLGRYGCPDAQLAAWRQRIITKILRDHGYRGPINVGDGADASTSAVGKRADSKPTRP